MAVTATTALLGRRRPYRLATHVGVALLLVCGLIGLHGSPASALAPRGGPGGGGPIFVPPNPCVPDPKILSFTATPQSVDLGASTTLSWNVQVPSGCDYTVTVGGVVASQAQGSVTVQPPFNMTYTLTLSWGWARDIWVSSAIPVSVNLPVDPDYPCVAIADGGVSAMMSPSLQGCRHKVTINANNLVPLFVQALGTPNTTVVVENQVQLDLSGLPRLPEYSARVLIADGVRLVGGRNIAGKPFQPGPLLYTTDNPKINALFEVNGDNVRVTGVRIQGPEMDVSDIDRESEGTGIYIGDVRPTCSTEGCGTSRGHINVEIDHNEFSGWSHAAVRVSDYLHKIAVAIDHRSDPPYPDPTEPVYIHDNFFHHNQHFGGDGYGVAVAHGAHALIERNVFDWNRHAISQEDGSSRSGYRAYGNLVLANGGLNHDLPILGQYYTHQFDMHGSVDYCVVSIDTGIHSWCVVNVDHYFGTAGHDYDIRYNSFWYNSGPAIKLRGTPEPGGFAVVRFNAFWHNDEGDAVEWTEVEPIHQDNLRGVMPGLQYDACDFDGDGIKDAFVATGQTLWYCPGQAAQAACATFPGSGQATWVYLNSSTKHINELALGYFSGGPVCDVVDGNLISVGGTGPWKPL